MNLDDRIDPEADPETDLQSAVRELVAGVKSLVEQGTTTVKYIESLERSIGRRTRALWAVVIVGAVLTLGLGAVALDNRAAVKASEQRWCPLLSVLVPQPGDPVRVPGPGGRPTRSDLVVARAAALHDAYRCAD